MVDVIGVLRHVLDFSRAVAQRLGTVRSNTEKCRAMSQRIVALSSALQPALARLFLKCLMN